MLDRKLLLTTKLINWSITTLSIAVCVLAMYTRLPGMTLLGIAPNWLLIWLVAWSVNRPVFLSVMVGIALGMVQDGMTFADVRVAPTHVLGLAIAGVVVDGADVTVADLFA